MKYIIDWFKELFMGVRERKVEKYLDAEVMKLGGMTRKWVSPGVNGVPDRIVIINGNVWFVEVKTDGGKVSSWQTREIKRLVDHGGTALVVFGEKGVDEFIESIRDEC